MWQAIRHHPLAVVAAVLAHLVLIALLVVSFRSGAPEPAATGKQIEAIEVVAVDEQAVEAELQKIRAAEQRKKDAARKAREARRAEERRLAQLKQQRKAEERKRKQEAERKRQQAAEKKRLAELEKKRKVEQERQRQAELAKQRREQQVRERQQQEAEQARREAELQAKLAAESRAREAAARQTARQQEIDKYQGLIKSQITRHWIIPATSRRDRVCTVKVRLIPGGDVVDVQIVASSGDPAFDKSVEKAVYRAAPLPVPADSDLFDEFREVIFKFRPPSPSL